MKPPAAPHRAAYYLSVADGSWAFVGDGPWAPHDTFGGRRVYVPAMGSCHACDRPLATLTPILKRARTELESFDEDGPTGSSPHERTVTIGVRVTLEPGFVDAATRHSSGHRLYVHSRHGRTTVGRVKLPAIIRCHCGRCPCGGDNLIDLPDQNTAYFGSDTDAQASRLAEQLTDEAGDQWIQQQIDIERGK